MGNKCIRGEIDSDMSPTMFKVKNVDDDGRELGSGTIEVGLSDLILYQKSKDPVRWPLRCLRRYGFDAELFSFESGRRCPTGPGIYAFKCKRAEQLFNLVQDNVERQGQADDTASQHNPASRSSSLTGADGVIRKHSSGSLSSSGGARSSSPHYVNGSVIVDNTPPSSASPRTPASPSSPVSPHLHNYVNTSGPATNEEATNASSIHISVQEKSQSGQGNSNNYQESSLNYVKLDHENDKTQSNATAKTETAVLNGSANTAVVSPSSVRTTPTTPNHCYANLDNLSELLPYCSPSAKSPSSLAGSSPKNGLISPNSDHTYANLDQVAAGIGNGNGISKLVLQPPPKKKINYIQLDLENLESKADSNSTPGSSPRTPKTPGPDTPNKKTDTYAMIDFDKTAALIKSQNGQVDHDDGSVRKTRHNSNMDP
ncbi:fibroblast growth factor receptor substrate 2-like isoform X2 [Ptychodera flava]